MKRAYTVFTMACSLGFATILSGAIAGLDYAFGDRGIAMTTVGLTGNGPTKIAIQPDGKILMCGLARDNQSSGSYGYDAAVVRFNPDGTLDTSFDGDGKVMTDVNSSHPVYTDDWANAVAVQPDGKIIVAGTTRQYTKTNNSRFEWYMWDLLLIRYMPDGSLDTGFANNGIMVQDITGSGSQPEAFSDVALQSTGKIVCGGYTYPGNNRFLVARYNTDGSIDTSFGSAGTGMVIEHFSGYTFEDSYDIVILEDDSILAVGRGIKGSYSEPSITILKLTAEGRLDTGFNGSGKLSMTPGYASNAYIAAADESGRLIIGGNYKGSSSSDESVLLIRLLSDGTPDPSFGTDGIVWTSFGDYMYQSLRGLVVDGAGKITGTGTAFYPAHVIAARWNEDGSQDGTFGTSGSLVFEVPGVSDIFVWNAVQQTDGKVVFGARMTTATFPETVVEFTVLRLGGIEQLQWYDGRVETLDGWKELDWFGLYKDDSDDWIWHASHGPMQVYSASTPDSMMYCHPDGEWYWTNSAIFPWRYHYETGGWVSD